MCRKYENRVPLHTYTPFDKRRVLRDHFHSCCEVGLCVFSTVSNEWMNEKLESIPKRSSIAESDACIWSRPTVLRKTAVRLCHIFVSFSSSDSIFRWKMYQTMEIDSEVSFAVVSLPNERSYTQPHAMNRERENAFIPLIAMIYFLNLHDSDECRSFAPATQDLRF